MRLLLSVLHARVSMARNLRHFGRAVAAGEAGDFDAMDRHLAKGRKGRVQVDRLMARVERLAADRAGSRT